VAALAQLKGEGSVLLALGEGEEGCARSFRNIEGVSVMKADDVGVAEIIGAGRLVLSGAALERLVEKAGVVTK
jgi:large subunit ribosomal protein L4